MSNFSDKDFVNDLSKLLTSYLEPLNLQFLFSDQELTLDEVFMKAGGMPMFLYDKQDFINYNLRHKKVPDGKADAFARIHSEPTEDSYFGFKIELIHNLVNNDLYQSENSTSLYENLLYSLAYKILSEKDFKANGKQVMLDNKYTQFMNHFNEVQFQKATQVSNVTGDKA